MAFIVRENLHSNPRYVNATGASSDGTIIVTSYTASSALSGGTAARFTRTNTSASSMRLTAGLESPNLLPSTQYTVGFDIVSTNTQTVDVVIRPNVGSTTGQVVLGSVALAPNVPQRIVLTGTTTATAMTATAGVAVTSPVGTNAAAVVDITNVIVETGATTGAFFSGATPDTTVWDYSWVGTANASRSKETSWFSLTLVTTTDPKPVQIVAYGLTAGDEYEVLGVAADGSTWAVPGGVGVADGPISLIDNRTALNTPVTYRVLVGGVVVLESAASVTVTDPDRAIIQALDGQTVLRFVLQSNRLPRVPVINSVHFNVPGRHRGPSRFEPAGDGGGSMVIRTDIQNTAVLWTLLHSGAPVVMRTDGTIRDLPAVDILSIDAAPSEMWDAVVGGEMSTDRVWAITYTLEDDPEPGTAVVVWDWDDFDAFWAGQDWDDFDAFFAGSNWLAFDTQAWE